MSNVEIEWITIIISFIIGLIIGGILPLHRIVRSQLHFISNPFHEQSYKKEETRLLNLVGNELDTRGDYGFSRRCLQRFVFLLRNLGLTLYVQHEGTYNS